MCRDRYIDPCMYVGNQVKFEAVALAQYPIQPTIEFLPSSAAPQPVEAGEGRVKNRGCIWIPAVQKTEQPFENHRIAEIGNTRSNSGKQSFRTTGLQIAVNCIDRYKEHSSKLLELYCRSNELRCHSVICILARNCKPDHQPENGKEVDLCRNQP